MKNLSIKINIKYSYIIFNIIMIINKIFYYIMNFFYASNKESNILIGEINNLQSTSKTSNILEEKNIQKNEIIFKYILGDVNDFKKKIIVKKEIKVLKKNKNKRIFQYTLDDFYDFNKNIIVKKEPKDFQNT